MRVPKTVFPISIAGLMLGGSAVRGATLQDVDWQLVSGFRSASGFEWNYSYDIGFFDCELHVDVDIQLLGAEASAETRDLWEAGIESTWSTARFEVPIVFNVDWVDENADQQVTVVEGFGRGQRDIWYTERNCICPPDLEDEFAAHEFGHMIGLYDEYTGGAVLDPAMINTGGLMHTLNGPTLDYYYDDIMLWYQTEVVPEPGALWLALLGVAGLVKRRDRPRLR